MDTGAQLLERNKVIKQEKEGLFEKLKLNGELIAAIVCGIFILAGWILSKNGKQDFLSYYISLLLLLEVLQKLKKESLIQLKINN